MAVTKLDEVKVPIKLNYDARAIVTKDAILKNRDEQLQGLLGRIKELLGEDEVLIIASNDALGKATRRLDKKKDEIPKADDVDHNKFWEDLRRDFGMGTITTPQVFVNTPMYTTTTTGNTYAYNNRRGGIVNRQPQIQYLDELHVQNLAAEIMQPPPVVRADHTHDGDATPLR